MQVIHHLLPSLVSRAQPQHPKQQPCQLLAIITTHRSTQNGSSPLLKHCIIRDLLFHFNLKSNPLILFDLRLSLVSASRAEGHRTYQRRTRGAAAAGAGGRGEQQRQQRRRGRAL